MFKYFNIQIIQNEFVWKIGFLRFGYYLSFGI